MKKINCYFELGLKLISGKWKLLIIYHIAQNKVIRFSELKKNVVGIHERMLLRQLRDLEKDRIIVRKSYDENIPKVEYSLSEFGLKLFSLIEFLNSFGNDYAKLIDSNEYNKIECDELLTLYNKSIKEHY